MARFRDEQVAIDAFTPHLNGDEQIKNWAYGVKTPPLWLSILFLGAIGQALFTKEYLIALTDQRLVVLQFSGGKVKLKEVTEYELSELTDVETKKGSVFVHLKINNEAKPFVAKFHRMGAANNREQSQAIADAICTAA